MLASLTCRLLIASQTAWRQLADHSVESQLPTPALHAGALGGFSVGLAMLAVYCHPHHDFSSVVRCTLAAIGGCVGATALALSVVPRLLQSAGVNPVNRDRAARYASVTSLPLAASGLALQLPSLAASFTAIALLGALAYRSGSLGADVFLGLESTEKTRVALLTALVATLPALLAAPLCPAR